MLTHFTKIGTLFTGREGHIPKNQMEALRDKGIDPLRVVVDFGKRHNMEVFWSMRMNDNARRPAAARIRTNTSPRQPIQGGPSGIHARDAQPSPEVWRVDGFDYGRPEVRERAFRLVEEVCRNYDVDGVELDFFRHPVFFRSTRA